MIWMIYLKLGLYLLRYWMYLLRERESERENRNVNKNFPVKYVLMSFHISTKQSATVYKKHTVYFFKMLINSFDRYTVGSNGASGQSLVPRVSGALQRAPASRLRSQILQTLPGGELEERWGLLLSSVQTSELHWQYASQSVRPLRSMGRPLAWLIRIIFFFFCSQD